MVKWSFNRLNQQAARMDNGKQEDWSHLPKGKRRDSLSHFPKSISRLFHFQAICKVINNILLQHRVTLQSPLITPLVSLQ